MALIFVLSSQSGLRVSEDASVDRPLRVVAHLVTFAVLAGLLLYAVSGSRRPSIGGTAIAFAITLVYAISDEAHQSLVPDRTGRIDDVLVDTLGAAVGIVIAVLVLSARERRSGPSPTSGQT